MTRLPPRTATWLLTRVRQDSSAEALVGDLQEEYQSGRGVLWYWKQVGVALAVGAWRDGLKYKVLALRSVVIGAIVLTTPLKVLTTPFLGMAYRYALETGVFTWQDVAGWGGYLLVPFWGLTGVCAGWIVARTHRALWGTAVLVNAVAVFISTNASIWMLLASGTGFARYRATLLLSPWFEGAIIVGLLVGGLMGSATTGTRSGHERQSL